MTAETWASIGLFLFMNHAFGWIFAYMTFALNEPGRNRGLCILAFMVAGVLALPVMAFALLTRAIRKDLSGGAK